MFRLTHFLKNSHLFRNKEATSLFIVVILFAIKILSRFIPTTELSRFIPTTELSRFIPEQSLVGLYPRQSLVGLYPHQPASRNTRHTSGSQSLSHSFSSKKRAGLSGKDAWSEAGSAGHTL